MQITKTTETASNVVFDSILEVRPGGAVVAVADLSLTTLAAGTPVGKDSNGLFHVEKTAEMQDAATNTATDYKVKKGHQFKVGDFIATGLSLKAYAITAITTTETAYDTISVGTTLGVALVAGDILLQATAQSTGTTSAYKYTPIGLVAQDYTVTANDNLAVAVVVRGSVKTALAPPLHSSIRSTLNTIRYVS